MMQKLAGDHRSDYIKDAVDAAAIDDFTKLPNAMQRADAKMTAAVIRKIDQGRFSEKDKTEIVKTIVEAEGTAIQQEADERHK